LPDGIVSGIVPEQYRFRQTHAALSLACIRVCGTARTRLRAGRRNGA
jgi:hypothetical protein